MTYYLKEGLKEMKEKNEKISNAQKIMANCHIAYTQATLTYLMEQNEIGTLNKYELMVFKGLFDDTVTLKWVANFISGVELK